MKVAVIEPNSYTRTVSIVEQAWDVLNKIVQSDSACIFMFTNAGQFDNDCYAIVSQLKTQYPNIERHYFHGGCDYDVGYVSLMGERYDQTHFPTKGVVLPQRVRTCTIVDMCDVLITCGGGAAVEYAKERKKHIIDLTVQQSK